MIQSTPWTGGGQERPAEDVVVRHAARENALGWNDVGKTGTRAECLAYIKEVWTDMRPLNLRKLKEDDDKV